MQDSRKKICIITLALCFITAFIYLFFPMSVSMQDSGALAHIEKGLGLSKAESTFENGNYAELKYKIQEKGNAEEYNGASTLYISPLVSVSKAFHKNFDIRLLGLFYLILMLAAIWIVLRHVTMKQTWQNITLAALLYFVFFDVAYLVYFNTLYTEAGFLVFLVLACALYAKLAFSDKPQKPTLILYYFCAFLLCGMKPNMAFAGIFFALMGLRLLPLRRGYTFRILNVVLAALIAVVPFFQFRDVMPANREQNLYNSVFYGILKDQEDVPAALEKLGLSSALAPYAGTASFQVNIDSDDLKTEFFDKIGYGDVVTYYLTNPSVFLDKWNVSANNAFENRPRYLGNYTVESGKEAKDLAGGFALYSTVKRTVFPAKTGFVLLFAVLFIVGAVYLRRKTDNGGGKAFCDASVILGFFSLLLFPVPVITFGESELARHMGVYAMLFDVMFVIAVCGIALIVTQRRNNLKEKYGVNQ